jgi:hypothetical protein
MKSIKVLMAAIMLVAVSFASCSKDDTGIAEGKMTSTIDGKSVEFTATSVVLKGTDKSTSKSYEYLIVTGINGTSQTDMSSFAVTVYSEKLEAKTYPVPTYSNTTKYDYLKGFSMGMYIPKTSASSDYYYSFEVEKSSGSVIITSVSATNVKGTYDMILVNRAVDKTKTMTLKGEFNAKISTYATK